MQSSIGTVVLVSTMLIGDSIVLADEIPSEETNYNTKVEAALEDYSGPDIVRFPIGRTRRGTLIWCLTEPEALNVRSKQQRMLIVGGLDGSKSSVETALTMLDALDDSDRPTAVACIPIANPDGWASGQGPDNLIGSKVVTGYPPEGTAYNSQTDPEQHCLWRFIGWFAPDVVNELHDEAAPEFQRFIAGGIEPADAWPANSLADAVRSHPVAGIATTHATRTVTSATGSALIVPTIRVDEITHAYLNAGGVSFTSKDRSQLRKAIMRRVDRTPVEIAEQLAGRYGGHLNTVMYQPALALVARLRLSELTGEETHRRDVEQIVSRYVEESMPTFGGKVSGSHLAGHLVFAELASRENDPVVASLVRRAADFGFEADGSLLEAMPFHNEMSDAVFMACPILTAAGRYTGDDRYFEMARRHLQFMQETCLRADGIYRHSPLCEAAWGRGNGFPALGLALCLSDLDAVPKKSPAVEELRVFMSSSLEKHLRALVEHQDVTGMWHQVIDDPGSYRELTSTCMITYAIVRGIRSGWLEEAEFAHVANRAWEAIKVRAGEDGVLFDVCTGTGKQKSLQAYHDRTAILGKDERGGAMALIAAVEMAAWHAEQQERKTE